MAKYNELLQQIEELKRQAEQVRRQEIQKVVNDIKAQMAQYGITLADLSGGSRGRKARSGGSAGEAKYRDPATGRTWTGRGRTPGWIAEAESRGQSRDAFLIK